MEKRMNKEELVKLIESLKLDKMNTGFYQVER